MRFTFIFLLIGLCTLISTEPIQQSDKPYKVADKAFLQKQKDLLRLFKYVFQSSYYKDQAEIAKNYQIEDHLDMYTHQQYVKEFVNYYKQGLLPRDDGFSIFNEQHRDQAVALFHVFYHAKDWDTFYKTACWARKYVNEIMFVYALNVAVLHRDDTKGMILPPIYEIYPDFFVNTEVINEGYDFRPKYSADHEHKQRFYATANYSGWNLNSPSEQYDMTYFTEDVGLNAYYYYFHLDYPFWMDGEEYGLNKDRRGELFYFVHQQLLARYYMERLSNDYDSIPVFDWKEPIKTGYEATMHYPYGLKFPSRPANSNVLYNSNNEACIIPGEDNHFEVQQIEDYERRIRDAVDSGFVFSEDGKKINLYEEDGFNTLGNIIESNPDSINNRFYGYWQGIAHRILGYSTNQLHVYKIPPSVMEYFGTTLRDPIFYQLYKRITHYFLKYKSHLPHYTYTQLNYPGVKIENVQVDKLITYFDQYDFEITNALYINETTHINDNFEVWARQQRLNHKPFTYKIDVQSDKATDVVVRVFFGPKYDTQGHEIPLNENRVNFVELDKFVHTLQAGKTVIERNSNQGEYAKDRTSFRVLYQHVLAALEGKEEFHLDMSEAHNGFPNRFMLPKGKVDGQMYQFYVYISPYTKKVEHTYDHVISAGVGSGSRYIDDLPFGYPFDREIKYERNFFVPNSYVEDVVVFHKQEN